MNLYLPTCVERAPTGSETRAAMMRRRLTADGLTPLPGGIPITATIPVARLVLLDAEPYQVEELRLRDLAKLQGWLDESMGTPLDHLSPGSHDFDPATRPGRLSHQWAEESSGQPMLGSAAAAGLLDSPAGRLVLLGLTLRRRQSHPVAGGLMAVLDRSTPAEWRAFERAAWGITPRMALLDEMAPVVDPIRLPDWPRLLREVAEARGIDPVRLPDVAISTWRSLCLDPEASGGLTPETTDTFTTRVRRLGLD